MNTAIEIRSISHALELLAAKKQEVVPKLQTEGLLQEISNHNPLKDLFSNHEGIFSALFNQLKKGECQLLGFNKAELDFNTKNVAKTWTGIFGDQKYLLYENTHQDNGVYRKVSLYNPDNSLNEIPVLGQRIQPKSTELDGTDFEQTVDGIAFFTDPLPQELIDPKHLGWLDTSFANIVERSPEDLYKLRQYDHDLKDWRTF